MHFKGARETLPQIGRDSQVDAVVEGTVTRGENRARVTAGYAHMKHVGPHVMAVLNTTPVNHREVNGTVKRLCYLGSRRTPTNLCLDEFPYLVNSDPSLPSVLQRWLDHSQPKQSLLVLRDCQLGLQVAVSLVELNFQGAFNCLTVEPVAAG